jgi:hypothetical protein
MNNNNHHNVTTEHLVICLHLFFFILFSCCFLNLSYIYLYDTIILLTQQETNKSRFQGQGYHTMIHRHYRHQCHHGQCTVGVKVIYHLS